MIYIIYSLYLPFEDMRRVGVGSDNENGPKQHVLRRLGHKYVFFIYFVFYVY